MSLVGVLVVAAVGAYVAVRAETIGREVARRQRRPDAVRLDVWFIRAAGAAIAVLASLSAILGSR